MIIIIGYDFEPSLGEPSYSGVAGLFVNSFKTMSIGSSTICRFKCILRAKELCSTRALSRRRRVNIVADVRGPRGSTENDFLSLLFNSLPSYVSGIFLMEEKCIERGIVKLLQRDSSFAK